ncbi:hypothetical protein MDAP_001049 [Mitosporidium daphniae]|uniref:Uncharacterized protein n=1 Tax=Mitosporidium daphniae TaxID=1485682 RepID=A0A098VUS3_9MICR|nr:uncharacterized protein DI09_35p90 [Mitosporidium daphniae]KGG51421.1 hypothetical protein DI09_35p90 [Mitosporidium daphniae]|eukprot:XP_013237879.1 uncharacterized protein DI09_35p90 [Mitosporidium daphniae]
MYLSFLIFFSLLVACKSASVYDATLSVDSSSGCPLISPVLSNKAPSVCECENSIAPKKAEEPIKEDKRCFEPQQRPQQPLRLLTMVSRIPLPTQPSNCSLEPNKVQSETPTQQCVSVAPPPAVEPSPSVACEAPAIPQKIVQKSCACVSVVPEPVQTTCCTKGKVFLRRGQTGKIITKANHIAPIERVSVVYEVATLAVPTTFSVVRTDYVPLTQTKTNVQTFAWTTFVVDEEVGCPLPPSTCPKPTASIYPAANLPSFSSVSSSIKDVKECQLATLCKKRKSRAAQTTTVSSDIIDDDTSFN